MGMTEEMEGGGGGGLEVLRKVENIWNSLSGDWEERELAWEPLVIELMNDVGNQCEHDHYLVYIVILFFPAAFINLVVGSSKDIRLSVKITQS